MLINIPPTEWLYIMPTVWVFFTSYLVWYLTSAKQNVAISSNEAKILWKMHRQNTNCTSRKYQLLTGGSGKISGFKFDCGYKYKQERTILSRTPRISD